MLFSPVSLIALLSLAGSTLAAPARLDTTLARRAVTASQTTSAFNTLTSQITSAKSDLTSALADVDTSDASAVYAVAAPILKDVDADIKATGASLDIVKRDLIYARQSNSTDPDLEEAAEAIANAIVALTELLEPLQTLIEANPVLGALLSPLFSNISVDLIFVTSGLFLVLTGVLDLVANLLSGLGSTLSGLGLGGLGNQLGL
ncbi:hypothetical protein JCM10213_008625 [Rhodosporidiobolus nylandii]